MNPSGNLGCRGPGDKGKASGRCHHHHLHGHEPCLACCTHLQVPARGMAHWSTTTCSTCSHICQGQQSTSGGIRRKLAAWFHRHGSQASWFSTGPAAPYKQAALIVACIIALWPAAILSDTHRPWVMITALQAAWARMKCCDVQARTYPAVACSAGWMRD